MAQISKMDGVIYTNGLPVKAGKAFPAQTFTISGIYPPNRICALVATHHTAITTIAVTRGHNAVRRGYKYRTILPIVVSIISTTPMYRLAINPAKPCASNEAWIIGSSRLRYMTSPKNSIGNGNA